jgi:hypothetical protein
MDVEPPILQPLAGDPVDIELALSARTALTEITRPGDRISAVDDQPAFRRKKQSPCV